MARTVRTKVYEFSELSEKAKQKAIGWYRSDYAESDTSIVYKDAFATAKVFFEIFDIKFNEINFDNPYKNEYKFNLDDSILELFGFRLARYIWNNYHYSLFKGKYYGKLVNTFSNGETIPVSKKHPAGLRHVRRYSKCTLTHECVLTGCMYDEIMLQPIYEFLNKPTNRDFRELLDDCVHSLCKGVQDELQAIDKDDFISEQIIANEYEFTKDGSLFPG